MRCQMEMFSTLTMNGSDARKCCSSQVALEKKASGIHDKSLQSIMTFDEAPYKTGWESSGSDGVKAAELIGLQGVPASYGEYIALV